METKQKVEDQIRELYDEIANSRKKILDLRKALPEEIIQDYELKGADGKQFRLSELFEDNDELLVIHNMGKACVFCTMWADGINGIKGHLEDRMPFIVVSPDDPTTQKQFAESRNWEFNMASAHESSFIKDLGFQTDTGHYHPGASALMKKDDGTIVRVGKDFFGPGDFYNAAWHFYDLFPKGSDNWNPKYQY